MPISLERHKQQVPLETQGHSGIMICIIREGCVCVLTALTHSYLSSYFQGSEHFEQVDPLTLKLNLKWDP